MASFRKVGDKWRAELYVNGRRKSRRFTTKGRAVAWAKDMEGSMRDGVIDTSATLADAFDRYAREVSTTRKGERWEVVRLKALKTSIPTAYNRISVITPAHIATWRDTRLQDVTAGTVRREMGLLRAVFEVARREWMWIAKNPMDDVRKPPNPPSRDRIISPAEIEALSDKLTGQYRTIFLLALETGMRLGEICGLESTDIHEKFVTLRDTKNGTSRDVALTTKARELVKEAPFSTTSANASAVFYKARNAVDPPIDCTFHDTRHTACVMLAGKLHILELVRMLGMRDTKTLMIYYSESAESIADKLG